jgi:general secretion pathway protein I
MRNQGLNDVRAANSGWRRMGRGSKTANRRGVSLLEIVLAMSIFTGAVVALNQISNNGARSAVECRLLTKAILRCESKMAEVVAAVEPLQEISETAFDDDPDWTWSLITGTSPHPDVLAATITVRYNGPSEMSTTSYTLTRLIRDPIVFEAAIGEVEPVE